MKFPSWDGARIYDIFYKLFLHLFRFQKMAIHILLKKLYLKYEVVKKYLKHWIHVFQTLLYEHFHMKTILSLFTHSVCDEKVKIRGRSQR